LIISRVSGIGFGHRFCSSRWRFLAGLYVRSVVTSAGSETRWNWSSEYVNSLLNFILCFQCCWTVAMLAVTWQHLLALLTWISTIGVIVILSLFITNCLLSATYFTKCDKLTDGQTRFSETDRPSALCNDDAPWLKWFCEAGGGGAHLTKPGWSKPHTHSKISNPTNLALFRHKITLYRLNSIRGLILLQGGSNGSRGLSPLPPSLHFNHWRRVPKQISWKMTGSLTKVWINLIY